MEHIWGQEGTFGWWSLLVLFYLYCQLIASIIRNDKWGQFILYTVNLAIFFLFINGFTSKLKWKIILLLMFKFWISLSSILEGHGTKMFNLALHTFWISSGPLSKLTTCTYSERKWNHLKSARGPLIIYSQSIWIEVRSDFQLLSRVEMRSSQICLGSTNS